MKSVVRKNDLRQRMSKSHFIDMLFFMVYGTFYLDTADDDPVNTFTDNQRKEFYRQYKTEIAQFAIKREIELKDTWAFKQFEAVA